MMLTTARSFRREAARRTLRRAEFDTIERGMEQLERRVLLDTAPIPGIGALENPNNPVVRLETQFGDIDIELFQAEAPNLVSNFIANLARYPNTAFTRVVPGQILQAGRAFDPAFYREVGRFEQFQNLDNPIRPNTARTIGAVNFANDNDLVTREFYFNLSDNPELDTGAGAGVVFARVLDDRSWDVVTTIAGLNTASLDQQMLDPTLFSGPFIDIQGPFATVPVTDQFNPANPLAPAGFVRFTDSQLIKAANVQTFYEHRVYYPEGFIAGENIREFVPIGNPNDQAVNYQIILRRERIVGAGENRDLVVDRGVIGANARGGIDLTEAIRAVTENGDGNGIGFDGEPYAIEIRSTLPLTATLAHYDFGSATGESFTSRTSNTWSFAQARTGADLFSFLVWHNTTGNDATVNITFFTGDGQTVNFTGFTPAHQRGGLNLAEVPNLPLGTFGIRMQSDQPLVAALSRYDTRGDNNFGSTELGVVGVGTTGGVLPLAGFAPEGDNTTNQENIQQLVTFLNTSDNTANITVTVVPIGVAIAPFDQQITLGPRAFTSLDFENIRNQIGSRDFSVAFTSTQPIVASASHFAFGDVTATSFSTVASNRWAFAEGFMDPARAGENLFERLAIHNIANSEADTTLLFRFGDGTILEQNFVIAPGRTLVINIDELQPLLDQAALGRNFYTIEISSDNNLVTQMRRYDLTLGADTPAGGFGTVGQPIGILTDLGNGLQV